ncbi:hypothetical protein Tco_0736816 [Tanacetum coccineum]
MLGRQVECLDGETKIVPLSYHLGHDIQIQFEREEFCLLTGLRFGVDYSDVYEEGLIPFRRRVFDSTKDGKPITGEMLEAKINNKGFYRINDHDVVSLCCVAILQLVLLGFEARHNVPDWILRLAFRSDKRLANDREDCDMYPWGSYVWPTLYYQLRNANVKRWQPLYATKPEEDDDDHNSYSLMRFTCAFKVLKELLQKDAAREQMYNKINKFMKGFPLGRPQHSRTQASTLFFEGAQQVNLPYRSAYVFPVSVFAFGYSELVNPYATTRKCLVVFPIWYKGRMHCCHFKLGNAFVDDNEVDGEVIITGVRDTDDYIVYENVDPSKQMNAWIDLLIRDRPQGARFTVAKSRTSSFHPLSKIFIIQTDPHIIGTLDGSTRLYPSWDEVDWVYMPINAGGDH